MVDVTIFKWNFLIFGLVIGIAIGLMTGITLAPQPIEQNLNNINLEEESNSINNTLSFSSKIINTSENVINEGIITISNGVDE